MTVSINGMKVLGGLVNWYVSIKNCWAVKADEQAS